MNRTAFAHTETLPCDKSLVVGQRIYSGLYSRGYGTVTRINGEQSPASCRGLGGVVRVGGRASFDICFDIGASSNDLPETILRGVQWTIYTDVASDEEVAAAIVRSQLFTAQEATKAGEAAIQFANAVAALKNDPRFAYLKPCDGGNSSKSAVANIRLMLKKHYPGVKFSVRSDYNCARIRWIDGPCVKNVDQLLAPFKSGSFDSMNDMYEFTRSPFKKVFGEIQYIFTGRDESDELIGRAIRVAFRVYAHALTEVSAPTVADYRTGDLQRVPVDVCAFMVNDLNSLIRYVANKLGPDVDEMSED